MQLEELLSKVYEHSQMVSIRTDLAWKLAELAPSIARDVTGTERTIHEQRYHGGLFRRGYINWDVITNIDTYNRQKCADLAKQYQEVCERLHGIEELIESELPTITFSPA